MSHLRPDVPHHRLVCRLRRIAHSYGLKLRRSYSSWHSGTYSPRERMIRLNLDQSYRDVASTFFHELAHFLDHRDGLFSRFYSKAPLYVLRRIALRAERHADDRGARECRKHLPSVRYVRSYRKLDEVQFLRLTFHDRRKRLTFSVHRGRV